MRIATATPILRGLKMRLNTCVLTVLNRYFIIQAFGASSEELDLFVPNGIISWGDPVQRVMEDGQLLIQQTRASERTPMITVLLEGDYSFVAVFSVEAEIVSQFSVLENCMTSLSHHLQLSQNIIEL